MPRNQHQTTIELTAFEAKALVIALIPEAAKRFDPECAEGLTYPDIFKQITGTDSPMDMKPGKAPKTTLHLGTGTEADLKRRQLAFLVAHILADHIPLLPAYEEALRLLRRRFLDI